MLIYSPQEKIIDQFTFLIWRSGYYLILIILSSGKHVSIFCIFWRAVQKKTKNKHDISAKEEKNYTSILSKSF